MCLKFLTSLHWPVNLSFFGSKWNEIRSEFNVNTQCHVYLLNFHQSMSGNEHFSTDKKWPNICGTIEHENYMRWYLIWYLKQCRIRLKALASYPQARAPFKNPNKILKLVGLLSPLSSNLEVQQKWPPQIILGCGPETYQLVTDMQIAMTSTHGQMQKCNFYKFVHTLPDMRHRTADSTRCVGNKIHQSFDFLHLLHRCIYLMI